MYQPGILEVSTFGAMGSAPSAIPGTPQKSTLGLIAIDCTPVAVSTSSSHPLVVPPYRIAGIVLSLVLFPLEQEAATPRLQPLHHVAFEQHLHSGPSLVSVSRSASSTHWRSSSPLRHGVFQHSPQQTLSLAASSSSSYISNSAVHSISAFSSHLDPSIGLCLRLSVLQRSNGCIHISLVGPCEPAKHPQRNAILCVIICSLFSDEYWHQLWCFAFPCVPSHRSDLKHRCHKLIVDGAHYHI
ncbi:hypothetical protein DFH09DRAFT_1313261 [Mycena vulgaris]|nr:hypothetical protein DFH09DRAFT_1313261 [Mycena vulgaris]